MAKGRNSVNNMCATSHCAITTFQILSRIFPKKESTGDVHVERADNSKLTDFNANIQ